MEIVVPVGERNAIAPVKHIHSEPPITPARDRIPEEPPKPSRHLQPPELRRSQRSTAGKAPVRLENDPRYTGAESHLTIDQALSSPKAHLWEEAMHWELTLLDKYQVYKWVYKVPAGGKIIDTKWVMREKEEKALSDPKRYKARLTARGFTQRAGIDYHDTYALVCREESWRLLICIRLKDKMVIRQYDIEGAFLNGPLQEDLYVKD